MKIALAHKRLDLSGGTERDLYRTAQGLRDLGHEIHLFCTKFAVEAPPGTYPHCLPVLSWGRTARLWSLARRGPAAIRRSGCDVVVGFGRLIEQDVIRCGGGTHRGFLERLGSKAGARRRLWQRLSLYHRTLLALEELQFKPENFKQIVAVSEEVKNDIMRYYSVPAERITVLYNGVDHDRFQIALRDQWRCSVRRNLAIPECAPVVLFVGSGFRRKGLDRLLGIWGLPEMQNVYLLVVGEDARIRQYRAHAAAVARERIVFLGRQETVEKFYAAADVVALPSIQEAFGNVVLEALSCGLPVVVARGVGAAEVLQGSLACGVVNNADEPSELVQKLTLQLRRAGEPDFPRTARSLAEQYSWQNHFRKLESVLIEACAARQSERVS